MWRQSCNHVHKSITGQDSFEFTIESANMQSKSTFLWLSLMFVLGIPIARRDLCRKNPMLRIKRFSWDRWFVSLTSQGKLKTLLLAACFRTHSRCKMTRRVWYFPETSDAASVRRLFRTSCKYTTRTETMPNRALLTSNISQTGNPLDHTVYDDVFGKNDKGLWYTVINLHFTADTSLAVW